ncbi:glycosyltransferase [Burkholderia ubonensis]|uniref:Glycosyltransferase n=1 Tax=Burkholderia ubonensis TaxID=101571 RepID=A0A103RU94_9BURK|nr:glycosyltransferase family 2 protein [Burkholderia ubonensis]AOJ61818.1 glycosyltransferase [Burkholderia ubonensis]KVG73944.1 glycosyltransferase [Burkholderia ubonensis]
MKEFTTGRPAPSARCTIAIPTFNHGAFLERALVSVFSQDVPVEVIVLDAGSTDNTREILERWDDKLAYWRSHPDGGQAQAINEGIARGTAPYVAWLNSDDAYMPNGLERLVAALDAQPAVPAVYGRSMVIDANDRPLRPYSTEAWNRSRFARRCFISQPATIMRREAWEAVGGLDDALGYALDYDLWWRLAEYGGSLGYLDEVVAATRAHMVTKTIRNPVQHYREAMRTVRIHYGHVPLVWYAKMPVSVGVRLLMSPFAH